MIIEWWKIREEWCKKCCTITISQCKSQENRIQWKAHNKNKHTTGWIAEEWNLVLKYNEDKKSPKLKRNGTRLNDI